MEQVKVTALREHPRRAGRYVVELDGTALGAVSVETIAELQLAVGRALPPATHAALEAATRRTACYDRALDALARRARSRADLGRWLRDKDCAAEDIEPTLDRLEQLGLLDDRAFALGFARARLGTSRGFGPRRVAAELARKGVNRRIVEEVLQDLKTDGGPDELQAAQEAAAKKLRSMRALDWAVQQRRLYDHLVRRGFGADVVRKVLDEERRSRGREE